MKVSDIFIVSVQTGDNNKTTNVLEIREIRKTINDTELNDKRFDPSDIVIEKLRKFYPKYKGKWEVVKNDAYISCASYRFYKKNATNEFIKVIIGLPI